MIPGESEIGFWTRRGALDSEFSPVDEFSLYFRPWLLYGTRLDEPASTRTTASPTTS